MSQEPTLFDEWHLQWLVDPTGNTGDTDRLHAELNAPAVLSMVENAIRDAVRLTPSLHPLSVQLTK
jgi:hypothetical protein